MPRISSRRIPVRLAWASRCSRKGLGVWKTTCHKQGGGMKITRVTPMVLSTPWRNLTFVKVETDDGLYGVGEVRLNNRTNALLGYLREAVPRYVIGIDPFDIEALVSKMLVNDFGRMGEVTM